MPRRRNFIADEAVFDLVQLQDDYDQFENIVNPERGSDQDESIDLDESIPAAAPVDDAMDDQDEDLALSDLYTRMMAAQLPPTVDSDHDEELDQRQDGYEDALLDMPESDDDLNMDQDDEPPATESTNAVRCTKSAGPRTSTPVADSDHSDYEEEEDDADTPNPNPGPSNAKRARREATEPKSSRKPTARSTSKKAAINATWDKKTFQPPNVAFTGKVEVYDGTPLRTPIDYFNQFLDGDVTNLIAKHSRNYWENRQKEASISHQDLNTSTASSSSRRSERIKSSMVISKVHARSLMLNQPIEALESEVHTLIGVLLVMGLQPLDDTLKHWSGFYRNDLIANAMSQDRFRTWMRNLHFVDDDAVSEEARKADRIWKIRPLVDKIRRGFLTITPDEHQSIDEQMIAFKGRHGLRQYMKDKPIRYGFKVFARASPDGFVHDFEVYQGKASQWETMDAAAKGVNLSEYAVVKMMRDLPPNCGYKIYADRYFSGVNLANYVLDRGDHYTGTIMGNRLAGGGDLLKSIKELEKEGRGIFDRVTSSDGRICLVRWVDSGCVHMISTIYGTEPLDMAKRSFKNKDGKYETKEIPRPHVIKMYNTKMGGVDLSDMFRSKYFKSMKCRRWYMYIFHYLINLTIRNAWVLYRREFNRFWNDRLDVAQPKSMGLFKFIQEIATTLCRQGAADRNPKAIAMSSTMAAETLDSVRYDRTDHHPIVLDKKRSRCPMCAKRGGRAEPVTHCEKCNVGLCIAKNKTCWKDYHTKK